MRIWIILECAAICVMAGSLSAVEILPSDERTNGRTTVLSMKSPSESADASTISLHTERKPFALATVVGDGIAVTKASELEGKLKVYGQNSRRKKVELEVLASDDANDLALLKFSGQQLTPVTWKTDIEEALPIGTVVSGSTPRIGRMRIGLRSAKSRAVKNRGATMGITATQKMIDLNEEDVEKDGAKQRAVGIEVKQMIPEGPAEEAGLKEGDLIVMINDSPTLTMEALSKVMGETAPGDELVIQVMRDEKQVEIKMTAASPSDTMDKFDRNQQMSGRTSRRKSGFSMVMQSDLPLPPEAMGGPLFALDGSAVGVLIAHADRVTTYAIPANVVQASVKRMLAKMSE